MSLMEITRMNNKKIEELEKLLNETQEHPIIVQPDGSLTVDRRRKGSGFIKTHKVNLGNFY